MTMRRIRTATATTMANCQWAATEPVSRVSCDARLFSGGG
jgi:hypothetical protein